MNEWNDKAERVLEWTISELEIQVSSWEKSLERCCKNYGSMSNEAFHAGRILKGIKQMLEDAKFVYDGIT